MNTEIEKLRDKLGQLSAEEREKVIETTRACYAALEPKDDYIRFLHEVFFYPLEDNSQSE